MPLHLGVNGLFFPEQYLQYPYSRNPVFLRASQIGFAIKHVFYLPIHQLVEDHFSSNTIHVPYIYLGPI